MIMNAFNGKLLHFMVTSMRVPVRVLTAGLFAVCLSLAAPLHAQGTSPVVINAEITNIDLTVNEQHVVPLRQAPARIAIGDPAVVDVQPLPPADGRSSLLLIALKPGTTDLQVWSSERSAPSRWRIHVQPAVGQAVQAHGPLEARVDVAGEHAVISGEASSLLEHERSRQVAAAAAGDRQVNTATIATSGMVQVEVTVVELSRSVMKDVGISTSASSSPWRGGLNLLPALELGSGFSLFYSSRDFSASLQLLEQNGMARVLAEPTLLALSGQSASFLSGGEIPVPQSAGLGTTTITYKPFGIGLTVTPTVINAQRIALKVAPEASELDYANAISVFDSEGRVSVMPALRMRRADTTIELGDGETYVISGLVSRETMANVNKIPLLGDLPIIGAFFRNVQYSQTEKELVIAVTPRLVKPMAPGTRLEMPGARQEKRNDLGNAWGYYLMGPLSDDQLPGFSR